jgi:ribokinase
VSVPAKSPLSRVCVVGSSNVDLTFRAPRLPRPGETLAGTSFRLGFGGKGSNQAVMAARLGATVTMVSRVGRDVFGEQTVRNYRDHSIDVTHVLTDATEPTGVAAILVDDDARNCILVIPGANQALKPADVQAAASAIRGANVVLCQLEIPVETALEAFRLARAAGVRTVLNPAPAQKLPAELLRLTDLCVPNQTEIELLTGQEVTTPEQAESAARTLLGFGPQTVLVTLGERGVVVVDGPHVEHVPAVAVQAVDPTGAGDVFIASVAVFLAEGMALTEAVRRASGAAALTVTRLGTQTAFPTRAEVEEMDRW